MIYFLLLIFPSEDRARGRLEGSYFYGRLTGVHN